MALWGDRDAGGRGPARGAELERSRPGPATRPACSAGIRRACTIADRRALEEHLRAAPEDLDGWRLAGDLSAGALTHAGERAYLCAQQLAAGAVLRRAARLVGPPKAATRTVREPMLEPWGGELDVEATLDNLLGNCTRSRATWSCSGASTAGARSSSWSNTSLSMAGEKMVLAAVAAAVLRSSCGPATSPWCCSPTAPAAALRFGEEAPPAELVRRMLAVAVRRRDGHRGRAPAARPRGAPARPRPRPLRPPGQRRRVHQRRGPAPARRPLRRAARPAHGGAAHAPGGPAARRRPPRPHAPGAPSRSRAGSRPAWRSARPSLAPPTAASSERAWLRRAAAGACSTSRIGCCADAAGRRRAGEARRAQVPSETGGRRARRAEGGE